MERDRWRRRRFAVTPDEEGMYEVRGKVPAEVGALVMRAVEAAEDALFREEGREETTGEQRRADALALVAERALGAGFGEGEEAPVRGPEAGSAEPGGSRDLERSLDPERSREPEPWRERGCACGRGERARVPVSGTKAERYQVFVHVEMGTLEKHGEPGRSHLEDGTRLAAETARRLTCDASVVRVLRGEEGEVLDLGRKRRTASPALRRALEIRDRGCRWPGCGLRFTQVHHVKHWADGGETKKDNALLLCTFHHRKVHEGGWDVLLNRADGTAVFVDPRGRFRKGSRRPDRWRGASEGDPEPGCETTPEPRAEGTPDPGHEPTPKPGPDSSPDPEPEPEPDLLTPLLRDNARQGAQPDGRSLTARYTRSDSIPWHFHARALEALDRAHFGV